VHQICGASIADQAVIAGMLAYTQAAFTLQSFYLKSLKASKKIM
jgi:hypothetical protein